MTYIARPGSITEKAVAALAAAGEALTAAQIAKLVSCPPASVDGILATAVKHGAVKLDLSYGTKRWSAPAAAPAPTIEQAAIAAAEKPAKTRATRKKATKRPERKARRQAARKAAVKRRVAAPKKRAGKPAAVAVVNEPRAIERTTPAFGLYSDGTLAMERAGERVFAIDYVDTLMLIKYLVSQKHLVSELFPDAKEGDE